MMEKKIKYLGLRIDSDIHHKFKYISEAEGRSMNGQVIYLIRQCIQEFERESGAITEPDEA